MRSRGGFSKKVGRNNQEGRSQTAETVQSLRKHYPLEILLPIAKLARSTFFYHRQSKPDRDSTLKARIRDIKQAGPNYGYRRVSAKLVGVNHKRIQGLIEEMGLQVRTKK